MNKPKMFAIRFGAVCDPLRDQLKDYGIPSKVFPGLQAKADAITLLYMTAILPEGETKKARNRLYQEIKALVSIPQGEK
jgi:hypothetical protein